MGEIVRAEAMGIPDTDVGPIKSKRESLHSKRAGSNFIRSQNLSTQSVCGMENSVKNHIEILIFHTAICFGAKTNSLYGRREIASANFSSPLRDRSLRNEDKYGEGFAEKGE